jgi:major membrane immunogen (membrane-anchored lipoprotein)
MKIASLLGAGVVLTSLLVSCSNEDLLQGSNDQISNVATLTAYIESDGDSRVEIADDGKFSWSDGDQISVQTSTGFDTWKTSSDAINGTEAIFTSTGDAASEGAFAAYPATLNPSVSDNTLTVTLPSEYTYSTAKPKPILVGTNTTDNIVFAHVGGLVRVTYTNVPEVANKFVFTASNAIAGAFTVEEKELKATSSASSTVTVSFTSSDVKDGSITFDIPVPSGTYSSFSASLYYDDNKLDSKTASKTTIARRDLWLMPSITVDFVEPVAFSDKTQVEVYDFALSDGTFVSHKASYLTDDMKKNCIGVVYWLDNNGEELAKDTALSYLNANSGYTHGLIVSLNYLTYNSSDLIAWQGPSTECVADAVDKTSSTVSTNNHFKSILSPYDNLEDTDQNITQLLGYNNTQVLYGYNSSFKTSDQYIVQIAKALKEAKLTTATTCSSWNIPALYELVYMADDMNKSKFTTTKLNAAFEKLGEGNYTPIKNGTEAIHWTSNEYSSDKAWAFLLNDTKSSGKSYIQVPAKTNTHYVRPVCIF